MTLSEALLLGTGRLPGPVEPEYVRLVWATEYFDGPLAGLAEFRGAPVWFQFANEENDEDYRVATWFRRFFLVQLPPDRLGAARTVHAAFQRYVGTHFDYDSNGKREPSQVRPQSQWQKFTAAHPKENKDSYLDCEVLGWFEL